MLSSILTSCKKHFQVQIQHFLRCFSSPPMIKLEHIIYTELNSESLSRLSVLLTVEILTDEVHEPIPVQQD